MSKKFARGKEGKLTLITLAYFSSFLGFAIVYMTCWYKKNVGQKNSQVFPVFTTVNLFLRVSSRSNIKFPSHGGKIVPQHEFHVETNLCC